MGKFRRPTHHECFNTLKNQGYHIEHNYGHGRENLCFNFYILTLLAFFFHQVLELTDKAFQESRSKAGTLREFWERLRQVFHFFIFDSWESLLHFAFNKKSYPITVTPQPP